MSLVNSGVYGYPCVTDPHDFSPDPECCSPEEIAAHARACDTFGTPRFEPNKGCSVERSPEGDLLKVVTRTSWGIGFNTIIETQCDHCGSTENEMVHCWECSGDYCCASCWPQHDAQDSCGG